MSSYLITGASRGLGLELVTQLLSLPTSQVSRVFALIRGQPGDKLQQLLEQHQGRAALVNGTVNDQKSIEQAVTKVEEILGGQGLDVLINNAGISIGARDGMRSVAASDMAESFDVNVIGVQIVTSAFLPLLQKGKDKKVINISSTLGSMGQAEHYMAAPAYAYKISKAGLNMMNKLYAINMADEGFTFLCVSPGWLKTDLGSQNAELEVSVGAKEVIRITQEATTSMSGKYVNIHVPGMEQAFGRYDGGEVPF